MFGNFDSGNIPSITSFAMAKKFYETTTPITRGPNKGRIPLRTNRADSDTYWVERDVRRHDLLRDKDEPVEAYVFNMYRTEIIVYYADGVIEISDYESQTTRKVQNRLTPNTVNIYGGAQNKFVAIPANKSACATLMAPFLRGHSFVMPFYGNMFLVPNKDGRWTVMNHGYYVRLGRTIHDPLLAKYVRAVQKSLRALTRMGGDQSNDPLFLEHLPGEGPGSGYFYDMGDSMRRASQHLYNHIEKTGWKEGQRVRTSDLNALLLPTDHYGRTLCSSLMERFTRGSDLKALRFYVQDGATTEYSAAHWVVGEKELNSLQAAIVECEAAA